MEFWHCPKCKVKHSANCPNGWPDIKNSIRLDVGCGANKQPGFWGMDKRRLDDVDVIHDVEWIPWPLPPQSCSVILMSHLIEHIKPWLQIDILNECWRLLEENGLLIIATPYATSFGYNQDPTHCSPWNEATPTYFDPDYPLYQVYVPKPWRIEKLAYDLNTNLEVAFRKRNDGIRTA